MISLDGWRACRSRCRAVAGRLLLVGGLGLLAASPTPVWALSAQEPLSLKADAPASYTVREGDTLWSIAARFLDSPWQWQALWQRNPQVASPRQLYPGDVIRLVATDGAPHLALERGRGETVRLSPSVRRPPAREAVPSLPLDRIRVFLESYQIVDPGVLADAPTVVAGQAQRLLSGAGDTLYAHGRLPATGTTLGIYRPVSDYSAPMSSESEGQGS